MCERVPPLSQEMAHVGVRYMGERRVLAHVGVRNGRFWVLRQIQGFITIIVNQLVSPFLSLFVLISLRHLAPKGIKRLAFHNVSPSKVTISYNPKVWLYLLIMKYMTKPHPTTIIMSQGKAFRRVVCHHVSSFSTIWVLVTTMVSVCDM